MVLPSSLPSKVGCTLGFRDGELLLDFSPFLTCSPSYLLGAYNNTVTLSYPRRIHHIQHDGQDRSIKNKLKSKQSFGYRYALVLLIHCGYIYIERERHTLFRLSTAAIVGKRLEPAKVRYLRGRQGEVEPSASSSSNNNNEQWQ